MDPIEAMELLTDKMKESKQNKRFLEAMNA
jgi:transcription termination factor Rho